MKRLQRILARLRGKSAGGPNQLAQEAIEGFQRAIESLNGANRTTEEAIALVNRLRTELGRARAELHAYFVSSLDSDVQVAELERLRTKEASSENV